MRTLRLNPQFSVFALLAFSVTLLLAIVAARDMPVRVAVGDHQLRVSITGSASPTVVLETFGPAPLETWNRVQPRIAEFARVVSYDHAGYWGSGPGPKPRDASRIAHELHAMLRKAALAPPYVLVGYSFGGPYIRVFASLYPEEVAGLVFVDPTQESFMAWLNEHYPEFNRVTEYERMNQEEWGMQWASMRQAQAAPLPVRPMMLITGAATHDVLSRAFLPRWQAEHAKWLGQFPHAEHLVTTNSGHGVVVTEPELVIDAVRRVVQRTRHGSRLQGMQ